MTERNEVEDNETGHKGLRLFGCILGTVTAAVTAMALTVVLSHIDG